jgi:uncharacterized protein YndB with AHSA1/START domain
MARGPKHVYEIEIEAPPERVWEALNDPEQEYNKGWTLESEGEEPGSAYAFRDEQGNAMIVGEILEIDPPRRLVTTSSHQWSDAVKAEKPSRVTYEITPTRTGCKLTVVHDDFETEDSPTYQAVEHGWPPILEALKALVEDRPEQLAEALAKQA